MPARTADMGGEIRVRLAVAAGKVRGVTCTSTRPERAAQMFVGRSFDDTAALIGRVFSLCGQAQTMAALTAIEDALDIDLPPAHRAARDVLRLAEMLTQTAMRLCLNWPTRLSHSIDPEPVRACLMAEKALETCLMGGIEWKVAGGACLRPDVKGAQDIVMGLTGTVNDLLKSGGHVDQLSEAVAKRGLQGFGALAPDQRPEQGALTRHFEAPSVVKQRAQHGAALAARLAAAECDLQLIPHQMRTQLDRVLDCAPAPRCANRSGTGHADVETARGPLTHRLDIANGILKSYDIAAPTESNFVPGGPVETGLMGADATDRAGLQLAAELHVLAIDPCVEFTVEIADA